MPANRRLPCIVDGQPFDSITLAAGELGLSMKGLRAALALGQDSYNGHSIAYAPKKPKSLRLEEEDLPDPIAEAREVERLEERDQVHQGGSLLKRTVVHSLGVHR